MKQHLVLLAPHPFPSIVKVPEYPHVAPDNVKIDNVLKSYSGKGYIEVLNSAKEMSVEFEFDAQKSCDVLVEVRYALRENNEIPLNFILNGKHAGVLNAWITSPGSAWTWDRLYLTLEKGKNDLKIICNDSEIKIDHIKVQNEL